MATQKKRGASGKYRHEGKARLELRFDQDVHDGIKAMADGAGISVNQLLQGIARWAVKRGHVGEPVFEEDWVMTREQPGCVWFGIESEVETDDGSSVMVKGEHYFSLDFTERSAVKFGR